MKNKRKLRAAVALLLFAGIFAGRFNFALADENNTEDVSEIPMIITSDEGINTVLNNMPEISAESAIVVDMDTGFTLYEKNIYDKMYPASTTKIMTAILALENLQVSDLIVFSYEAVNTIEYGSSSAYLRENESMSVEQCLYGLLMISANDIANGLGEAIAGTQTDFAAMMNDRAIELGCVNTNFVNAHGLHNENHYSCAYDMAIMAKYAFSNFELYREIITTQLYMVAPSEYYNETRYWYINNKLVRNGSVYHDDDCLGGKNGATSQAGGTLVSYHSIKGRNIIIVVMHESSSDDAYVDTLNICKYLNNDVDTSFFDHLDQKLLKYESGELDDDIVSEEVLNDEPEKKTVVKENDGDSNVKIIFIIIVIIIIIFVAAICCIAHICLKRKRIRRHRYRKRQR